MAPQSGKTCARVSECVTRSSHRLRGRCPAWPMGTSGTVTTTTAALLLRESSSVSIHAFEAGAETQAIAIAEARTTVIGAGAETRTRTTLRSGDFKSPASTSSATPACAGYYNDFSLLAGDSGWHRRPWPRMNGSSCHWRRSISSPPITLPTKARIGARRGRGGPPGAAEPASCQRRAPLLTPPPARPRTECYRVPTSPLRIPRHSRDRC